jgi:drug/metabolite transporter (DMT)-like permease
LSHSTARLRAAALALFVTFLWSTSWLLIRTALDDDERLAPITFAGLRYGFAAVLVVTWSRRRTHRIPAALESRAVDRRGLLSLAALGAVMYGLTQGAQFVAIDAQPAATTNLLLAMTPLAVAFTSAAFLGEPTTARQRTGGAVIIVGAVTFFAGDLGATTVGMVAATIALLANAVAALFGRAVNRSTPLSATSVTAISMSVGALLLLVAGLVVDGIPRPGLRAVAIIAWLAVVNTAFAWTWWNHAQRALTATETAAINTSMAVQIPVLAWIFLDEPLGLAEIAGIALVVVGVLSMRGGAAASGSAVPVRQVVLSSHGPAAAESLRPGRSRRRPGSR